MLLLMERINVASVASLKPHRAEANGRRVTWERLRVPTVPGRVLRVALSVEVA